MDPKFSSSQLQTQSFSHRRTDCQLFALGHTTTDLLSTEIKKVFKYFPKFYLLVCLRSCGLAFINSTSASLHGDAIKQLYNSAPCWSLQLCLWGRGDIFLCRQPGTLLKHTHCAIILFCVVVDDAHLIINLTVISIVFAIILHLPLF